MKIYNTLTKNIEEFKPNDEKVVTMYTCGPTVYHYAHIGNLRTYVFEDILEKTLNYIGYNVKRAMNITDVGHLTSDSDTGDDKMAVAVKRENKTVFEIAEHYTKAFFDDLDKLNIKKPEIIEKATSHVDKYIKMVEKMLEEGYAYQAGGNVYFDVTKINNYYELSGKNPDDLKLAVREEISEDKNKKNPFDFGLWFTDSKFENHILEWDSPWGKGYPGWHIECCGIAINYLGEHLDIHCGAIDLTFPHHTNEIAQAEAYLGHKWCNYWVHGEFLNDATGKMSKSKGEFLTLNVLQNKGYNPLAYRFLCLQSHYRNQLVFSYEAIDIASHTYNKLLNKVKMIKENASGDIDNKAVENYKQQFKATLENDLNTSMALTTLYDVIKDDNINNNTKLYLIDSFDQVLSLSLLEEKKENIDLELENYIKEQLEQRNIAKANKDYELADQIRNELKNKGIIIKDTKDGTIYELEK